MSHLCLNRKKSDGKIPNADLNETKKSCCQFYLRIVIETRSSVRYFDSFLCTESRTMIINRLTILHVEIFWDFCCGVPQPARNLQLKPSDYYFNPLWWRRHERTEPSEDGLHSSNYLCCMEKRYNWIGHILNECYVTFLLDVSEMKFDLYTLVFIPIWHEAYHTYDRTPTLNPIRVFGACHGWRFHQTWIQFSFCLPATHARTRAALR